MLDSKEQILSDELEKECNETTNVKSDKEVYSSEREAHREKLEPKNQKVEEERVKECKTLPKVKNDFDVVEKNRETESDDGEKLEEKAEEKSAKIVQPTSMFYKLPVNECVEEDTMNSSIEHQNLDNPIESELAAISKFIKMSSKSEDSSKSNVEQENSDKPQAVKGREKPQAVESVKTTVSTQDKSLNKSISTIAEKRAPQIQEAKNSNANEGRG